MARPSLELKRRILGRTPLFAGLEPEELDALGSVARTQTLGPREELFHKGDEGAEVCVVVEGRLKVLATSAEGDDLVFGILGAGEMLGEISLLAGCKRTATVTALDDCTLLVIDRRAFLPFLERHPRVAIQLLGVVSERLKRASELLEDALFLNLPFRLAKKLCAFASAYGEKVGGEVRIDLKLSQEEWGDLVGATRESINKQIRAWTEAGLVHVDGGYVVIRDPEALERLAGCVVL